MSICATACLAQIAEGPGRAQTEKLCSSCHELDRAVSLRQNRDGWKGTINRMVNFGADGTEAEFAAVLEYLSANYAASELPPLNVNTARAIDFESRLSLKRSQAAAIIQYRAKHGQIKSIEELKNIPGGDSAKVEAKKDILVF
jgi:competence protein ComEA